MEKDGIFHHDSECQNRSPHASEIRTGQPFVAFMGEMADNFWIFGMMRLSRTPRSSTDK